MNNWLKEIEGIEVFEVNMTEALNNLFEGNTSPVPQKYVDWMDAYAARFADKPLKLRGMCREACEEMLAAFPELKQVRGHVMDYTQADYPQAHWWLVLEVPIEGAEDLLFDTLIIDPTRSQYGAPLYDPWDESQQEPTGKCPNCGEYCFNGDYCCTKSCHDAYLAYCNNPY